MSGAYSVVVNGQVAEGFDLNEVKKTVAAQFKLNDAQIEKVFSGKPISIRRGLEKESALKLRDALTKAGAVAVVKRAPIQPVKASVAEKLPTEKQATPTEQMPPPSNTIPSKKPTLTTGDNTDLPASPAEVTCPRCGHTQSLAQACSRCKMDFALHLKRLARKEKLREFRLQNKA